MRKIHRLDLDFAKDIRTQRKITFKEQDSITLYMSIYNDGVPVILDNQTPRLFIKKSDGTILYQTEVLSIQNNVVAFDVHRQATTCPGLCYAEVEFIEDEELITTRSFVYIVEPKVGSIKDAIASVNEAYFLKIVEEFIAQAKIDIAEFRDAVASLEDRVIEVDNKLEKLNEDLKQADLELNEAKENALEEISDFRYEAIDDVQEARDEAIDTITLLNNETVQIIDQIKNNSINLIIDEKDNSIKEMSGFKDDCLEAIELLKNGTVSIIYQAKNNSINEINDTVDKHLTTIENNAMQSKEEITGLTNESKEAIEALGREVIDNIDDYTIEHIEELESIIESLIPTVGEGKELEASLISLQENLTILKDTLQKLNGDGYLLSEKLESNINIAKTTQSELLTAKNEAISVKVALNQVIEATESLKNTLILENERAEANIEELQILHPESDIRIEELRRLIELAKQYEEVVRTWIANREPAMNLDEVNAQLEELYNAVSSILSMFDNYYTKEEVDKKINNYKGEIGYSEYKVKPEGFDEKFEKLLENPKMIYPNMKGNVVGYIQGTISRQTDTNSSGKRVPGVILFTDYNNIYNTLRPTITKTSTNNGGFDVIQLKTASGSTIDSSNRSYMSYPCIISPTTGEFIAGYSPDLSYGYTITDYYYSTVDIYNANGVIAYPACQGELPIKYNDCNDAIEEGNYKVNIKEGEVVENMPTEGVLKGILIVDKANEVISQELIIENNVVYRRVFINNTWTEWQEGAGASNIDLSSLATKEELQEAINNIDIPEVDLSNHYTKNETYNKEEVDTLTNPYKGVIGEDPHPVEFRTAPPMLETEGSYIRCSSKSNVSRVHYFEKTDKLITSDSQGKYYDGCYVWGLPSNKRIFQYNKATSTWDLVEKDSYARIQAQNVDILDSVYSSNVDLYMDRGSTLVVPAKPGDPATAPYNTYNLEEAGEYKVSHTNAIEGCYTDTFDGSLVIRNINGDIYQELTSDDCITKVIRARIDKVWTDWKSIGGQEINLDDFYTKEEVDEKLIKKVGAIKSGNPDFKEPVWDELPETTFINIPANPDPATYKWEMKCSHYGYHMVFYFPIDPTGKFGIIERNDGKLGFKLLDKSFTYTTYKSYYKSKNTSTSWNDMPSDNHFTNPDKRELEAMYSHNFDIVDGNNPNRVFRYGSQNDFNQEYISDFDIATKYETYTVEAVEDSVIGNSPINGAYKGILKVYKADKIIHQELELNDGRTFKRMLNNEWTEWKEDAKKDDLDSLNNIVGDLAMPIPDKVQTITYTNSDGMPEIYKWTDINGFKIMWIDVKHSEAEYNSGVNGLMMKTLNFPAEAQIFNNIIMANITSYCRSSNNTLSRIVQNAEIISNVSVRGRWRHTDNTPPSIDRFTIMCFGF